MIAVAEHDMVEHADVLCVLLPRRYGSEHECCRAS